MDYVGPLPTDLKFYDADYIRNKSELDELVQFLESNRDKEFNLKQELIEYCSSGNFPIDFLIF